MTLWDWDNWTVYTRTIKALIKPRYASAPTQTSSLVPWGQKQPNAVPSLDLHGMTLAQAFDTFCSYVEHNAPQQKSVLIITGIGGHNQHSAIRRELPFWIEHPRIRSLVLSYTQAPPHQGGRGAFIITFRGK